MAKVELQGLLIEYNPTKQSEERTLDFRCGNSRFTDDVWDFKGFVKAPQWNDAKFKLDFTSFSKWESIKTTLKWYIASELNGNGFNTVRRKLDAFSHLRVFIDLERPDVSSFSDFDRYTLKEYFEYLLKRAKKLEKGKASDELATSISAVSQRKCAQVIKELLIRGGTKGWEVPNETTFIEPLYQTLIIENKDIKEGTKFGKTNKVLPDQEIIDNLIRNANIEIEEGDCLTGTSIILSSQMGLRITEVISVKEGCLSVIGGEYYLTYTTSKTTGEPIEVTSPANKLVVDAIRALEEKTKELRIEASSPYLFMARNRTKKGTPPVIASYSNWSKNRLKPFVQKYDIRNGKGEYLNLTHHYFRHIFATYALKSGMKIHDVAEMMNHKSILMTDTYDGNKGKKQESVKKILTGEIPVASTNTVVLEALQGDENPFKGTTADQFDKLRRALKVEILPHGVCLHHPLRGEPCEQDGACLGCGNFLASAIHLPVYEMRLTRVKKELETLGSDSSIYSSKLRYQMSRLERYVSDLSRQLAERELHMGDLEAAVTLDD